MADWDPSIYGERVAHVYDDWYGPDPVLDAPVVEFLARRAGSGPVLELGVGTGRFALPLAERGLPVHGIDASEAMLKQLEAKPGGERVTTFLGDFAEVAVEGPYRLVYVVKNTFALLASQDDQVRCFQNVARRLSGDGVFVIGGAVPDPGAWDGGQQVKITSITPEEVRLWVGRQDPVSQQVMAQDVVLTNDGVRLYPELSRYAWPSELDLMARLAGLRLAERWAGWQAEPFTAASARHISVYARGGPGAEPG